MYQLDSDINSSRVAGYNLKSPRKICHRIYSQLQWCNGANVEGSNRKSRSWEVHEEKNIPNELTLRALSHQAFCKGKAGEKPRILSSHGLDNLGIGSCIHLGIS